MGLRLIQPGRSAAVYPRWHALAGQKVEPLGILPSGKVVWPGIGGAEDQDDPDALPEGEDEDEDEDEEDQDDPKSRKKSKKPKDDDEEDDDDEEGELRFKASRQARRYRLALREEQKKTADMAARLKAIEDKDKKPDEVVSRDLSETRNRADRLAAQNAEMTAQLAFFRTPIGIEWADASDVFALAQREGLFDDVIDEDGTVDARELRRGLKDLAKRKPHLVKTNPKASSRKEDDDDEEDDEDEEPRPKPRSTMNGKRKGLPKVPDRAALAKNFPVLNRF